PNSTRECEQWPERVSGGPLERGVHWQTHLPRRRAPPSKRKSGWSIEHVPEWELTETNTRSTRRETSRRRRRSAPRDRGFPQRRRKLDLSTVGTPAATRQ